MGEVTISVAGRAYQVICEDGEEERLSAIAGRVDLEAQAFGGQTPSLSEARLLLMCSLLLADKLDEAEKSPQSATSTPLPPAADIAAVDASAIEQATARIEALASKDDSATASEQVEDLTPADQPPSEPETDSEDETGAEMASEADTSNDNADQPAEQTERRSKSTAAMAAEKDLLNWQDRAEPQVVPDDVSAEAEDTAEAEDDIDAEEAVALDEPAEADEFTGADENDTENVAPDPAPELSEEERGEEERSERRKRRRERLARLAKHGNEEQ